MTVIEKKRIIEDMVKSGELYIVDTKQDNGVWDIGCKIEVHLDANDSVVIEILNQTRET